MFSNYLIKQKPLLIKNKVLNNAKITSYFDLIEQRNAPFKSFFHNKQAFNYKTNTIKPNTIVDYKLIVIKPDNTVDYK